MAAPVPLGGVGARDNVGMARGVGDPPLDVVAHAGRELVDGGAHSWPQRTHGVDAAPGVRVMVEPLVGPVGRGGRRGVTGSTSRTSAEGLPPVVSIQRTLWRPATSD